MSTHIRPLNADEFHRFNAYIGPSHETVGVRSETFDQYVAKGSYRDGHVSIAEQGRDVVARAAFWSPPESVHAWCLDFFDFDPGDPDVGRRLMSAAYEAVTPPGYSGPPSATRPEYDLFLPSNWRDDPHARQHAQARIDVAEGVGLNAFVERLNLRWTAGDPLPPRPDRLRFAPVSDDAVLLALLERIAVDTLDAHDRREIDSAATPEDGRRASAAEIMEFVANLPGGRDRWRLAYDADDRLVGTVMPTRNVNAATIGYMGVDPAFRGNGYSVDLIAEALHIFADEQAPVVSDNTDLANTPMHRAFELAGYRQVGRRIIFT